MFKIRIQHVIVVFVTLVVIAYGYYYLGEIPRSTPDERNRVFHPSGFSIVKPPYWQKRVYGNEELGIPPGMWFAATSGRYSSTIGVSESEDVHESKLAFYKKSQFQGEPCYTREDHHLDTPELGPQLTFELLCKRNDRWYSLNYHYFGDLDSCPPIILEYFSSFKVKSE